MRNISLISFISILMSSAAYAEEGGSGTYTPGAIASAIDSMLPNSGTIFRTNLYNYSGKLTLDCLDTACASKGMFKASSQAVSFTFGWKPEVDLGKNWSYMMSTTVPYWRLDAVADITNSQGTTTTRDSRVGLGDIELIPINISYHLNTENQFNFKGTIRAPTGSFDTNRLANLGKNFWSYEPTIGFIHVGQERKNQFSIYSGLNFNQTNQATDYKSGTQAHVEFTAERRFLNEGENGVWGVGLTGYFYSQIADDEQFGVRLNNSRARAAGIGPVLSYTGLFGDQFTVMECKWLHDYSSYKRFEGDTILLKVGAIF